MSTDIKYFTYTNNNAPTVDNVYGSMIALLDACLLSGFIVGSVSSLTVSGTIATLVFSQPHNLLQYQVIRIIGANQTEFNKEHRILSIVNTTTITFDLKTIPSVTTATGTITASLPPLGWEKPFSSVNGTGGKAAYRSLNTLLPSRPFLRVVDEVDPLYDPSFAKYAKVGIVENMTDIDTMLGVQSPYNSTYPDRNWIGSLEGTIYYNGWAKWYYARSNSLVSSTTSSSDADSLTPVGGSRSWTIIGNGDYFYVLCSTRPSTIDTLKVLYGFGSFNSLIPNDTSNTFLISSNRYNNISVGQRVLGYTEGTGNTGAYSPLLLLQRKYTQEAVNSVASCCSLGNNVGAVYTGQLDFVSSVAISDNTPFAPVYLHEGVLRGVLPSYNWLFQNKPLLNNQCIVNNNSIYFSPFIMTTAFVEGQCMFYLGEL